MKPFNLEKALAGEPVVTRDGRKVEQLTKLLVNGAIYLVGVWQSRTSSDMETWRSDGTEIEDSALDLFMAEPVEWEEEA